MNLGKPNSVTFLIPYVFLCPPLLTLSSRTPNWSFASPQLVLRVPATGSSRTPTGPSRTRNSVESGSDRMARTTPELPHRSLKFNTVPTLGNLTTRNKKMYHQTSVHGGSWMELSREPANKRQRLDRYQNWNFY
ncbi:hypothetical protein AVEN_187995-1 [Araneus ventricosus]|uniref:Uncharacterized protein n=1 Tax=Araneus ventricosus TaxID=182803 RepID=A0A4Y2J5K8_ARAVE|nr:hypothetical protein AVEN_187995-1 [Araneus ventricosus]